MVRILAWSRICGGWEVLMTIEHEEQLVAGATWRRVWRSTFVCAALGMASASLGCTETVANPNYCAAVNGNAFCRSRHGDGRGHCIWGSDACIARLAPDSLAPGVEFDGCIVTPPPVGGDECYSPCGGGVGFDGECFIDVATAGAS